MHPRASAPLCCVLCECVYVYVCVCVCVCVCMCTQGEPCTPELLHRCVFCVCVCVTQQSQAPRSFCTAEVRTRVIRSPIQK